MMELQGSQRLRIYTGEQAKHAHRPLYEEIVHEAMQQGMAGATVVKGMLSFGHEQRLHAAKILEFGIDLPMVVELVDTQEKIDSFLIVVQRLVRESGARVMVTCEDVRSAVIE
ncbi:MAG: DUF190 domain-containing protein [Chlorobi bacterium]|nr:DUF190 domain-containing protein [Chlorobiota bacterium]